MSVDLVLDYPANKAAGLIKKGGKPRRLHRADCRHPEPQAAYRKATAEELRTLPECADCAPQRCPEIGGRGQFRGQN